MKKMCMNFLRMMLPVLFVLYTGMIVSFTHVHIINGVTIVHAHPYNDDSPNHTHTGTELQLLHQLSTIQQIGSCTFDYVIKPFYSYETTLDTQPVAHRHICKAYEAIRLRAPPFFI